MARPGSQASVDHYNEILTRIKDRWELAKQPDTHSDIAEGYLPGLHNLPELNKAAKHAKKPEMMEEDFYAALKTTSAVVEMLREELNFKSIKRTLDRIPHTSGDIIHYELEQIFEKVAKTRFNPDSAMQRVGTTLTNVFNEAERLVKESLRWPSSSAVREVRKLGELHLLVLNRAKTSHQILG